MWTNIKPNEPCVFVTRDEVKDRTGIYSYDIWILDYENGYLAIMKGEGEEWGAWDEFKAEEYFIIEYLRVLKKESELPTANEMRGIYSEEK